MSKKQKKAREAKEAVAPAELSPGDAKKARTKAYEKELARLQVAHDGEQRRRGDVARHLRAAADAGVDRRA